MLKSRRVISKNAINSKEVAAADTLSSQFNNDNFDLAASFDGNSTQ